MKPETELRNLRAEVKRLRKDNFRFRNTLTMLNTHTHRLDSEIVEWKERFDNLLKVLPPKP